MDRDSKKKQRGARHVAHTPQRGTINRFTTNGSNQPEVHHGSPLKLFIRSESTIPRTATAFAVTRGASSSAQNAKKQMSKRAECIERAVNNIQNNYKVLVLLRGLPGSGKSFLGRNILSFVFGTNARYQEHLLSTDDFFVQNGGRYIFDPKRLQEAHDWNQRRASEAMNRGLSPVIIDNTNMQMWEMKPYAETATDCGYLIHIVEPDTWWSLVDKELTLRNTHNVSELKIREMLYRYEKNVTVQKLMQYYNLSYKFQKPPQFRVTPPFRSRPENNNNNDGEYRKFTTEAAAVVNDDFQKIGFPSATSASTHGQKYDNNHRNSASFWQIVNPIDKILICGNSDDEAANGTRPPTLDDSNYNAILQPEQGSAVEKGNDDLNLKNAWGLDERTLQSWDIVMPLEQGADKKGPATVGATATKKTSDVWDSSRGFELVASNWGDDRDALKNTTAPATYVQKVDSSTWMESLDIQLMTTQEIPENLPADFLVICAQHRDINSNTVFSGNNHFDRRKSYNQTVMFDKICSTDDIPDPISISDHRAKDSHLQELKNRFQHIPLSYLRELFEECNRDFNWTVDLLSDDDTHYSIDSRWQLENGEENEDQGPQNSRSGSEQQEQTQRNPGTMGTELPCGGEPVEQMGYVNNETYDEGDAVIREFKTAPKHKHIQPHEKLSSKQCLEEKFDIGNEQYSEHDMLKVEQCNFGGVQRKKPMTTTAAQSYGENTIDDYYYNENTSAQSESQQLCCSRSAFIPLCERQSGNGKRKRYRNGSSPSDGDNQEAVGGSMTRDEFDEDNPKNTIEPNLGEESVARSEMKFYTMIGRKTTAALNVPEEAQSAVQLLVKLPRQLYTSYMESVCQQMERQKSIMEELVKEDEEFARKLQAQEDQQHSSTLSSAHNNRPTQPLATSTSTGTSDVGRSLTLVEIMNEQKALKELERQWKSETADDLAARLTRQKLFENFPNIKQDVLIEILHAYGNDYNRTVEDVAASVGVENINQRAVTKEPPVKQTTLEMQHDQAGRRDADTLMSEELKPTTCYREKANEHLERRQELYNKATTYLRRGLTEVAMFYSRLAQKETMLYNEANNMAARFFPQKKVSELKTIDLHNMYVKEAIPALDVFIDRNINFLMAGRKLSEDLFVITGHGMSRKGGTSKIKPAVIARLKKRHIGYIEVNPGRLKIKITRKSSVTSNQPGSGSSGPS